MAWSFCNQHKLLVKTFKATQTLKQKKEHTHTQRFSGPTPNVLNQNFHQEPKLSSKPWLPTIALLHTPSDGSYCLPGHWMSLRLRCLWSSTLSWAPPLGLSILPITHWGRHGAHLLTGSRGPVWGAGGRAGRRCGRHQLNGRGPGPGFDGCVAAPRFRKESGSRL